MLKYKKIPASRPAMERLALLSLDSKDARIAISAGTKRQMDIILLISMIPELRKNLPDRQETVILLYTIKTSI